MDFSSCYIIEHRLDEGEDRCSDINQEAPVMTDKRPWWLGQTW